MPRYNGLKSRDCTPVMGPVSASSTICGLWLRVSPLGPLVEWSASFLTALATWSPLFAPLLFPGRVDLAVHQRYRAACPRCYDPPVIHTVSGWRSVLLGSIRDASRLADIV